MVVPHLPVVPVLGAVQHRRRRGFTTMEDDDLARFRPLPELDVPTGPYLLLDVDPGADTLNVPPAEVLPRLTAAGRSPLTIAEGLAVLVSDPASCAAATASRCSVRGRGQAGARPVGERPTAAAGLVLPGAPHTWLGSASCAGRAG